MLGDAKMGVASKKGKLACRIEGSHVGSRERSNARSVDASLMMLKRPGAGAEPKGRRVSRYAIFPRMAIQVTADFMDV